MEWVDPMNATLSEARVDEPGWIYERKLDGFRFIAYIGDGEAQLLTRNKNRHRFPAIEAVLLLQELDDTILDGEVVWGDRRSGAPRGGGADAGEAEYCVFDILRLQGHDVTGLPLHARKQLLKDHFDFVPPVALVEPLSETGTAAFERAQREGWEGVMAKRLDSVYEHKRSRAWLKLKVDKEQEFVVGGFTEPSGQRAGFGALLIGYYDGDDLVYAGKLGTGFDTKTLNDLYARMRATEIDAPPFTKGSGLPRKDAHWVTPSIVVDAAFMEWTSDGKLRHPKFRGERPDKSPRDVTLVVPPQT